MTVEIQLPSPMREIAACEPACRNYLERLKFLRGWEFDVEKLSHEECIAMVERIYLSYQVRELH